MFKQAIKSRIASLMAVCVLALAACGDSGPQAPPPPEVKIYTVKLVEVPRVVELPGRVQAVRTAEVRARVDGIIERRLYQEGTDVKAKENVPAAAAWQALMDRAGRAFAQEDIKTGVLVLRRSVSSPLSQGSKVDGVQRAVLSARAVSTDGRGDGSSCARVQEEVSVNYNVSTPTGSRCLALCRCLLYTSDAADE